MRRINKGVPIDCFANMIAKDKPINWNEFHAKHQVVYNDIREYICIIEQDCLCGYTELPINDIQRSHVDHYRKKSLFTDMEFDWNNFVISVIDNNFGANHKDNNYCNCKEDYCQILNPIEDSCECYFEYTNLGEIEPKKGIEQSIQEKARKTIEVFNLNHESLTERRKTILSAIISVKDQLTNDMIQTALANNGFKSFIEYQLSNL